jgi:hypothetical protein
VSPRDAGAPDPVRASLGEAIDDSRDLSLIYSGQRQLASLQFWLLLRRIECGFPAGRDSIAHLLELVGPSAMECRQ